MMDMLQMGCIGAIDLIGWSIRIELFYYLTTQKWVAGGAGPRMDTAQCPCKSGQLVIQLQLQLQLVIEGPLTAQKRLIFPVKNPLTDPRTHKQPNTGFFAPCKLT
jgi:hypothetical protein